jgi:hypothetical protein
MPAQQAEEQCEPHAGPSYLPSTPSSAVQGDREHGPRLGAIRKASTKDVAERTSQKAGGKEQRVRVEYIPSRGNSRRNHRVVCEVGCSLQQLPSLDPVRGIRRVEHGSELVLRDRLRLLDLALNGYRVTAVVDVERCPLTIVFSAVELLVTQPAGQPLLAGDHTIATGLVR